MKVVFKSTEGDYLEAIIEVEGEDLIVMDEFGGDSFASGQQIDIFLNPGLVNENESWESMFSSNPDGIKKLEHISGWRYRAYGIIECIDEEVEVDVGFTRLVAPIYTNDIQVIGASVAFTIDRLDGNDS